MWNKNLGLLTNAFGACQRFFGCLCFLRVPSLTFEMNQADGLKWALLLYSSGIHDKLKKLGKLGLLHEPSDESQSEVNYAGLQVEGRR
jgi:hypothetical protein